MVAPQNPDSLSPESSATTGESGSLFPVENNPDDLFLLQYIDRYPLRDRFGEPNEIHDIIRDALAALKRQRP